MNARPAPATRQTAATQARDYSAEMVALVDSERACSDPAGLVASRIVDNLRATDPQLLSGYLDLNAVAAITELLTFRDRSDRGRARTASGRADFAQAVAAGQVSGFLDVHYAVDETNSRLPLGQMGNEHLRYVADHYGATAKKAAMEEAFFRALAKKVRRGVVADYFDEGQLAALRASLP